MKAYLLLASMFLSATIFSGCSQKSSPGDFTSGEIALIKGSADVMYVLDVSDKEDEKILRMPCEDLSVEALKSDAFQMLQKKMLATVQSPQQGGVGIAAPQVGLTRRVVVVCRTDKDDEPYEVYPNIRIVECFGEMVSGPEGCLSIAPYRGEVKRYQSIRIEYTDPVTLEKKTESIEGYTAVIFQHECDHLDGILYTDRADTVFVNNSWEEERKEYAQEGLYDKSQAVARLEAELLLK